VVSKLIELNADRTPRRRLSATTGATPQSSGAPERNASLSRRKAPVVVAARTGVIKREEAFERYKLPDDELAA
jgi:hypothetical protein